ncbi:MAG: hypothetical protein NTZ55_04955 [Candidatus Roizmanbacteria bacterium]|nr:hypothetical protein [Candidatus Roizmanbacteria bacterium]
MEKRIESTIRMVGGDIYLKSMGIPQQLLLQMNSLGGYIKKK